MPWLTIFCRHCSNGIALRGSGRLPAICPHASCGRSASWSTEAIAPRVAYDLGVNDRALLARHQRIVDLLELDTIAAIGGCPDTDHRDPSPYPL